MLINSSLLLAIVPKLLKGLMVSLSIASLSCFIGLVVGIPLGIIVTSRSLARYLVATYVLLVRGTPMLIQIFFALYCLPQLGIHIAPFWIAVYAIGLNSAAYVSQIVRAGIHAVPRGQIEAGQVLGFSPLQTMRYIILPQAVRITFPAFGNEFINLIKDSALASTIGVMELARTGQLEMTRSYDVLTVWAGVGACYLLATSLVSGIVHLIEKRMNNHVTHT
jgi:His/Glu/Gln/Arg/opine family amino acid ABC transporter permease subunit